MSSIRYKVKIKRAKPEKKNQPNFVLCYLWKWELFKTHSAIHKHFLLPIALLSFISRALYGLTQGQLILLNCCFPLPAVKKITRNKTPSREFSMDYCNPPQKWLESTEEECSRELDVWIIAQLFQIKRKLEAKWFRQWT